MSSRLNPSRRDKTSRTKLRSEDSKVTSLSDNEQIIYKTETVRRSTSTTNVCNYATILHDLNTCSKLGKHKSAFLPYKSQATVLTNLQRGNTEATLYPIEVELTFHERCGQNEITEEQIRTVLKQRSIDFTDSFGYSPLHWASYYGQLAAVQMLIKAGADVNKRGPELTTPLLLAAAGGHHEIARCLLDYGANIEHMDIMGNTALMYGSVGNYPHTCHEILSRNPDITLSNENGDTAYTMAIKSGATLAQSVLEQYLIAMLTL